MANVFVAILLVLIGTTPVEAFSGKASYYWHGQRVACGGRFNPHGMTTAHRSLPCGTKLMVTKGHRSVLVTVNDRGPFRKGRVLDLSLGAAKAIGLTRMGVGYVQYYRVN